jgi:hypothetical protein
MPLPPIGLLSGQEATHVPLTCVQVGGSPLWLAQAVLEPIGVRRLDQGDEESGRDTAHRAESSESRHDRIVGPGGLVRTGSGQFVSTLLVWENDEVPDPV